MTTSAPASFFISGLNGTARSLAIYASRRRLPGRHARLASGRWPSSAGRGSVPRRVPTRGFRDTIASSSPKLSWRPIDWKYALGLELTDPGFDFSVLCEFRARLVSGGAERLLLEA